MWIYLEDEARLTDLLSMQTYKHFVYGISRFAMFMPTVKESNEHIYRTLMHFYAASGKDYTYHPKKVIGITYNLRKGYQYGKENNFKGQIRMKSWDSTYGKDGEEFILNRYSYIAGGHFDENCTFQYTAYI